MPRRFKQVDVFSQRPCLGNPLAVILDAEGLSDAQMQTFARWTNLSETTFALPPSTPEADYRVRIFTPDGELPFAGHPTLGTAHALLETGLAPRTPGRLVQECGAGLIELQRHDDGSLAFRAPPARFTVLDDSAQTLLQRALGEYADAAGTPTLVTAGIGWLLVPMDSLENCLATRLQLNAVEALAEAIDSVGVALYARHPAASEIDYEIRALIPQQGSLVEDPVTGSANACLAHLLQHLGEAPAAGYRARQGTAIERDGRIQVSYRDGAPWIGGHSLTLIDGQLAD